jgi:hypothetical protein
MFKVKLNFTLLLITIFLGILFSTQVKAVHEEGHTGAVCGVCECPDERFSCVSFSNGSCACYIVGESD